MVASGDVAPDFDLVSDSGERVALSQFHGGRTVVYFYPKAGTGG